MEKERCYLCLEERSECDVVIFLYSCHHWICWCCHLRLIKYGHSSCPLCLSSPITPITVVGGYQIFLRNIDGRTLVFHVSPSKTTMEDLKYLIYYETNIAPSDQRLNFNGRIIEDNKLVSECNIERGSTIHLLHLLRGD
jgi:hypothetical protein